MNICLILQKKTLLSEEKIVNRKGNEKWKKIFYSSSSFLTKNKINLGIIKYYKRINFITQKKEYIIQFFSKKFLIKTKDLV